MDLRIRRAAVLGSGVMGAAIAAHLANVGIETILLDLVPEGEHNPRLRNSLAINAKEKLTRQKPSPIYTREVLDRIQTGNLEDDLHRISHVDWIIEAVVEKLEVKQALLAKVEQQWKPGTIVSSNTSGISVHRMIEGRSDVFQQHFLGTHFFNPPRYMKLLEIIPTAHTKPEIIAYMHRFCEIALGKGVVLAKDSPNFIANRIGTYGMLVTLAEMEKRGLSVSDVDVLTGPIIGRPKSATFRTLDLVGLDTFLHVVRNVYERVNDPAEKEAFQIPDVLQHLVEEGSIGDKAGRGFYQVKQTQAGKEIEQFDVHLKAYTPKNRTKFTSIDKAKSGKTLKEKLNIMCYAEDVGGSFVWSVLKQLLLYAAAKIPEIADDIVAIDKAMKWGFNWELGPFEIWDAIGVERSTARMEAEGAEIPAWIKALLAAGKKSFYEKTEGTTFYIQMEGAGRTIKQASGASLVYLGDDVACLELHEMNNVIGPSVLQMIATSLEEVHRNYRGLVVCNQGKNFCVGANLMMLLMEAQDENWFEIEQMIRQFQGVSMAMKYSEKPIVSAPYGMTLGGGVEICLPAAQVQAAAETYMGLVEVGVGLIPAGAGTKEMLLRFTLPVDFDGKVDLQPYVNRAFETIGMAKVSTSAHEAIQLGYLRLSDRISINQNNQLYEAKQAVLALSAGGYRPPEPKRIRVVGEPGLAVLKMGAYQLRCSGHISDFDEVIAKKLANVLAGGQVPANTRVTEQYLLDLEREAFLSLCGEPKSQARMQHMLLKGKPLRN
jgi:3-hydroxyacyl-CoA dehydrogenase